MSAIPAIEGSGQARTELVRRLSLGDLIAIVVGMMIGCGISGTQPGGAQFTLIHAPRAGRD